MKLQLSQILMTVAPLVFVAGNSFANPTSGTMIGEAGGDILNYECSTTQTGHLICDFVQVLMTKQKIFQNVDEEAASLIERSKSGSESFQVMCREMRDSIGVYEGVLSPSDVSQEAKEIAKGLSELSIRNNTLQLEEALGGMKALNNFCQDRSFDNAVAIVEMQNRAKATTCQPVVNKFSLEFVQVSKVLWAANSTPSGSCGVVDTSKFEQSDKSGYFWNFVASKIVLNPNGAGAVECSLLDTSEYIYRWDAGKIHRNCVFLD